MIPISAKLKAWLVVILIGVIAALKQLAAVNPTLAWAGTLVQVLGAIELYLTVPSGAQEQMRALRAAGAKAVAVLAFVGAGAAGALGLGAVAETQACLPQQGAAIVPAAACVASVVADAIAGLTVAQIVAKEGPGCVTDAEEVAAILLGSAKKELVGTVALDEARAKRGLPALRPSAPPSK